MSIYFYYTVFCGNAGVREQIMDNIKDDRKVLPILFQLWLYQEILTFFFLNMN